VSPLAARVRRTYLVLVAGNTLAASFIWGINTLFLLDAGLTNVEAFTANAFFTAGMVLFEVPTGVVADGWGRRISYLLGTVVLAIGTALYLLLWWWHSPFWAWAAVSVLLGLGFTFFSGAVEAWLVDALRFAGYSGGLEPVFGRAQVVGGAAMLVGAMGGGLVAQVTNLGVPYLLRVGVLLVMTVVAAVAMKDLGFAPDRTVSAGAAMRAIVVASVRYGLRRPPVRWLMVSGAFLSGVGIFAFYAMQPYLLRLYGDTSAYWVAGLAAAVLAGSQMVGGMLAAPLRRRVRRRTSALLAGAAVGAALLFGLGLAGSFALAVALLVLLGLFQAAVTPVRQAYLNDLVPSGQRATVLSFDSLLSNAGGVVVQPALGRVADLHGYGASYLVGAAIQLGALPFLALSRTSSGAADRSTTPDEPAPPQLGTDSDVA